MRSFFTVRLKWESKGSAAGEIEDKIFGCKFLAHRLVFLEVFISLNNRRDYIRFYFVFRLQVKMLENKLEWISSGFEDFRSTKRMKKKNESSSTFSLPFDKLPILLMKACSFNNSVDARFSLCSVLWRFKILNCAVAI